MTTDVPLKTSFTSTGKFSIYSLSGPDGAIRYIGITKLSIEVRLNGHMKSSRRRATHRDRWIKSLGFPPKIRLIETTDDPILEMFWIRYFRADGFNLTNLTEGGDGISGYRHTPESRAKMSAFHKGRPKPESSRINYSEAAKKRWESPGLREGVSQRYKGHKVTSETRKKISEARARLISKGWKNPDLVRKHSPERLDKNRQGQLRRSALGLPGNRKGAKLSEATKQKLREALERRKMRGEPLTFKGPPCKI